MTREEAIQTIESNRPSSGYTMLCEALDMAISALRQQEHRCPCDLCGLGPPSSMNGKPCTMCPAVPKPEHFREDTKKTKPLTLNELRSSVKFGYPVYLVGMEDGDGFVFIHHVDSLSVRYSRIGDHPEVEYCFRTKSYGVRVWAYLQKPEEVCNG